MKGLSNMHNVVVAGIITGYLYAILLSTSAIVVCESRGRGDCSQSWNQGFSVATGLVATFLAYFVKPNDPEPSTEREDAEKE